MAIDTEAPQSITDWIPDSTKARIVSEVLYKHLYIIPPGESQSNLQLIVEALMRKCREGNIKAMSLLLDRVEGKPSQDINVRKLEISITGEDMLRVINDAKAALQRKLLAPVVRVLPPEDIEAQIVDTTNEI